MRFAEPFRRTLLCLVAAGNAGCGDSVGPTRPTEPDLSPSYVRLESDPGDYIGAGRRYEYSLANAVMAVTVSGGYLSLRIDGDETWSGDFQSPKGIDRFEIGSYTNLRRYPFHDDAKGGLNWSGEGRGCNTLTGSFTVERVSYVDGNLVAIDLRFEQHCEGQAAALRGTIHLRADDTTRPPGPVTPVPTGLWQPPSGSTPPTGNYVYLVSDAGDYIGRGATYTYTQANAVMGVTSVGGRVSVTAADWHGDFQAMSTLSQLQTGYYPGLQRYPFHNPAKGGLSWSGQGRGCNTLTGWFAIDRIEYSGSTLTALDLRFEQHCEGGSPALHGAIHWRADDTTTPPGPVNPPPAGLWQPPAGSTPSTGNYVYLASDAGDYIGGGLTETYTPANAKIAVTASGGYLSVTVGDWHGDFQTMNTLSRLEPGYYPDLSRYPFHNPAKGGLSWSGQGRGCNTLRGWFVVDRVTYAGSTLTAVDLRFEQHCEGAGPALHGAIRWGG